MIVLDTRVESADTYSDDATLDFMSVLATQIPSACSVLQGVVLRTPNTVLVLGRQQRTSQ
jgi:hypothetical protein